MSVEWLATRLRPLGWVSELFVGGSAATGDHRPGVSDLDLVALVDGPVDAHRLEAIVAVHRDLDATDAAGADLGCAYVDRAHLSDPVAEHPTWTHGTLVERTLSGIARAELVRHGFAVIGRPPQQLLPAVTDDDVRRVAHAELIGYWTRAARRPWWWLDPVIVDLGLTSMVRGRHALATGSLMDKTSAIAVVHAPEWLRADLLTRRNGMPVRSPRLRTGWIAWRDARRTTAAARRWRPVQ